MELVVFSSKSYDRDAFQKANQNYNHQLKFLDVHLNPETITLSGSSPAICAFVNDVLNEETLKKFSSQGGKIIALRSAGYNHVDLKAAKKYSIKIVRVPAYSPSSVAEHTIGLLLCLNRKIHKAYARVREGNFSLEGLTGFDLASRTVGVIGTGNIGFIVARILKSFGSEVLASDPVENPEVLKLGIPYVPLKELLQRSDVITLHCPLNTNTFHIIDEEEVSLLKSGAILVNTSRGALINTQAVLKSLKSQKLGGLAIDVYEEEEGVFFEDGSARPLADDTLARLLTFPNVLITGHQAFLTHEALSTIAETTLNSLSQFEQKIPLTNEISINT